MTTRFFGLPRPMVTLERIVALLLGVMLGFWVLAFFPDFGVSSGYLLLLIVTVVAVRGVPVEPGAWLGVRGIRRLLVSTTVLITIAFLVMPASNEEPSVLLLIALALCDLALGRATRRIGSAQAEQVDERQEAIRNRAHRLAYLIFAVSVTLVVVLADMASSQTRAWLADASHGGPAISFLELLFFLPAMIIAWIEPDRIAGDDAPRLPRSARAHVAYTLVGLCLLVPLIFSLTLPLAPIRSSAFTKPEPTILAVGQTSGDRCLYFQARNEAGFGFGATIPISAVACWNGSKAYESWGLNASDCHPGRTEFVSDTTIECRRVEDADGTLHFTYRTRLRSAVLPFITRDVVMKLVLTKDGKVVEFP